MYNNTLNDDYKSIDYGRYMEKMYGIPFKICCFSV